MSNPTRLPYLPSVPHVQHVDGNGCHTNRRSFEDFFVSSAIERQRRLALPLGRDDIHNSRSVNQSAEVINKLRATTSHASSDQCVPHANDWRRVLSFDTPTAPTLATTAGGGRRLARRAGVRRAPCWAARRRVSCRHGAPS